ncbi:hypothetical protein LMH87_010748 [Akanthomyces muscarius]|uniref:Uncharacterized protein n=1 Tax=Akanthomyces muscarius TaxID=2231603 RepID=A0A9W8UK91_AKAMU|nr:hypothetical protein LMH87_010748 [Akanthomyces muscarius]KAJ4149976.1 hypothetical protein LMH87_010748 [Akanthomyces muscarius]
MVRLVNVDGLLILALVSKPSQNCLISRIIEDAALHECTKTKTKFEFVSEDHKLLRSIRVMHIWAANKTR